MISDVTSSDWVDFWENEESSESIIFNTKELISLKEEIIEQIGVAASVWDWTSFEEDALTSLINNVFLGRGVL
jgi:hypothetical protein